MKLKQGRLVKWENTEKQQIVWMVTEETGVGVVIHSDNLLAIGTVTDLTTETVAPFVGNVNISSKAN